MNIIETLKSAGIIPVIVIEKEEQAVPLQGRQGSRGCIPDAPGETGIHLE